MRRIFTFSFIAIALSVASFNSFGQACNVSTTAPTPTPPFGSTVPVQGSATPGADFNSSNQGTLGTFNSNSTTELTSRIVYYTSSQGSQTAVYFKYNLASTHNIQSSTPSGYTITLIYGNPQQTLSCTGTWTAGAITPAGANYYFTISGITWPADRYFRIRLTLNNGSRDVAATAFQANATFPVGAAALPVKFQSLDARMNNSAVSLKWNVATEENLAGYEIEKGIDGRNYSKIAFVAASGQTAYSFVDNKPASVTYYRIKSVDLNGRYAYSTVALVKSGKSMIVLKAFPSPVTNSLTVQHGTANAGSLITINSEDGRTIRSIVPATGTQETKIDLSAAKAGMYLVRYATGDGEVETVKILKQQ